jgi:hypothetical protein
MKNLSMNLNNLGISVVFNNFKVIFNDIRILGYNDVRVPVRNSIIPKYRQDMEDGSGINSLLGKGDMTPHYRQAGESSLPYSINILAHPCPQSRKVSIENPLGMILFSLIVGIWLNEIVTYWIGR